VDMFKRILVPLDGSALAEAILPEVTELAKLHHAEVLLVRVALGHAFPGVDPTEAQVRVVEEAETYLAAVQRRLVVERIHVDTAVRYGQAAEEILDHVRTRQADLIAMSTHGRSGIERWVMGSVAEKVLRASAVPVLLLRARVAAPGDTEAEALAERAPVRPRPAEEVPPAIHDILCPVDFSPTSEAALEHAGALAQRLGLRLTVLHVVDHPLYVAGFHIPHPPMEQMHEELIQCGQTWVQDLVARKRQFLPATQTAVVLGTPYKEILRYAQTHEVDLIVMGTHGLTGLHRLVVGSTAERIVRLAPCPVFTVRVSAAYTDEPPLRQRGMRLTADDPSRHLASDRGSHERAVTNGLLLQTRVERMAAGRAD
jgi:nucleotide-binding universal stress UspA family protein